MDSFSISQLARFSGIKTHTIRAGERRYNALSPDRSEGNTRHYSGEQLRRLLNLVSLLPEENKLAELCALSDSELAGRIRLKLKGGKGQETGYFSAQLISAGLDFDEERFNRILHYSLEQLGVQSTYAGLIYPCLDRLGLMWAAQVVSPAHEHFISNLILRKLNAVIDGLPMPDEGKATWLLFLPEEEFHEIGLLMSSFILRHAGHKVIYLGSNVPFSSLAPTVKKTGADNALFFLVRNDDQAIRQEYMERVASIPGLKHILVAAHSDAGLSVAFDKRIRLVEDPEDLRSEIDRIKE